MELVWFQTKDAFSARLNLSITSPHPITQCIHTSAHFSSAATATRSTLLFSGANFSLGYMGGRIRFLDHSIHLALP